jgi:hypothetical protein
MMSRPPNPPSPDADSWAEEPWTATIPQRPATRLNIEQLARSWGRALMRWRALRGCGRSVTGASAPIRPARRRRPERDLLPRLTSALARRPKRARCERLRTPPRDLSGLATEFEALEMNLAPPVWLRAALENAAGDRIEAEKACETRCKRRPRYAQRSRFAASSFAQARALPPPLRGARALRDGRLLRLENPCRRRASSTPEASNSVARP